MKTIIELYDEQSLLNLLAVCAVQPQAENVVFIGEFCDRRKTDVLKHWVDGFLQKRGIRTKTFFVHTDTSDYNAVIDALRKTNERFPGCALEVCGGQYLTLLAAGVFAERVQIPIFHYSIARKRFENIRYAEEADEMKTPAFTAEEMIELAHAGRMNGGHFSSSVIKDSLQQDVRALWGLFLSHKSDWHRIMVCFQSARSDKDHPLPVTIDRTAAQNQAVSDSFLRELEETGLIRGLTLSSTKISFTYKNRIIRAAMQDAGAALELFTYLSIRNHPKLFHDCEINLCVDWDGAGPSHTSNELDVVAVSGVTTLFISCKSGKLDVAFLNEIYTLTVRLGGRLAKPVLMTAALFPGRDNTALLQRAKDLGIEQIAVGDICPLIREGRFKGGKSCAACLNRACENTLAQRLHHLCK